jgi:Sulfotransferase family
MADSRGRVAFVGGVGRTGSTLIELALGQLPEACPLGEVRHMWERSLVEDQRCGCGRAFSGCPFWTEVGQRAFGGWNRIDVQKVLELKDSVDKTRHVPRLLAGVRPDPFDARVREYTDLYEKIYAAAREISGRPLIIDSSKHISMAAALSRAPRVDLRVVHVVRHPLGVAHSWSKVKARPEITSHEAFMPQYTPTQVSLQWDAHQALFELLRMRSHSPQLKVRYEDFVAEPARALREIAEFLGARPADAWVDEPASRTVTLDVQHTVAGNPLRFTQGPVEVRPDEGWRTGMQSRSKATVVALTLPMAPLYGYSGTRTRSARSAQSARPSAPPSAQPSDQPSDQQGDS